MSDPTEKPIVLVPPSIAKLRSPIGVHRRGMKILIFGESKSGKSYFLSHMPHPIFAIDAGEGGIQSYLDADKGDQCFEATSPEAHLNLCDYALNNEDKFASLVIDPVTTSWEDWMDYWSEKLGGQITGPQWRQVKGPWKALAKRLNRSKLNVGQSAWLKDILYEKPEKAPGVEGSLTIRPIEVPQVERKTIYHVDIILQTAIVRDIKNRPTTKHRVTLAGGRRPKAVDPEDFHVGKTWTFDARKPIDPWKVIIDPILEKWDNGAVDHLGIDERDAENEMKSIDEASQDYTVGQILMLMEQQTSLQTYKDRTWPNEISPIVNELDKAHQDRIMKEHDILKKRLKK